MPRKVSMLDISAAVTVTKVMPENQLPTLRALYSAYSAVRRCMVNMEKREYMKSRGTPALMPVLAMAFGRASITCPICRNNSDCKIAVGMCFKAVITATNA